MLTDFLVYDICQSCTNRIDIIDTDTFAILEELWRDLWIGLQYIGRDTIFLTGCELQNLHSKPNFKLNSKKHSGLATLCIPGKLLNLQN